MGLSVHGAGSRYMSSRVKGYAKGPKVSVSGHTDLVKHLFESQVAEVRDSTVEIKGHCLPGEAGSRTKDCGANPMTPMWTR